MSRRFVSTRCTYSGGASDDVQIQIADSGGASVTETEIYLVPVGGGLTKEHGWGTGGGTNGNACTTDWEQTSVDVYLYD